MPLCHSFCLGSICVGFACPDLNSQNDHWMCSVTDAGLTGEQFSSLFGNGAEEHVALLSTIQYSSE